jgi:uncharacterized membrane protein
MRTLSSVALIIAGMLVLGLLGLLFKVVLGRYAVAFVLAFFGLTFIVTFAAFLLFILTVPLDTSQKN